METVSVVKPKKKGSAKKTFDDPSVHRTKDVVSPALVRMEERRRNEIEGIPNQLAEHFIYFKNDRVEALLKAFPYDSDMVQCDRYYPNASQGPLWIDTPADRHHEAVFQKKAKVMKESGLRYAYILPGETIEAVRSRMMAK